MKKFIKENKKTLILVLSFLILLSIFIVSRFNKEEVKQPKEEVKTYLVVGNNSDDKYKLTFEHYKTYKDTNNKKILIILQKTVTDYNSNFKYYINTNEEKKELKIYLNDEHTLALYADMLLDSDYKIICENQENKKDIQEYNYKIKEVINYDLSKITYKKFKEHEKLTHNIASVIGKIKITELDIKEKEKLLKYTENKLETFTKNKNEENIKRFQQAKKEVLKEIETLKSKKQEHEKELEKLNKDNEELEEIVNKILGNLHKH